MVGSGSGEANGKSEQEVSPPSRQPRPWPGTPTEPAVHCISAPLTLLGQTPFCRAQPAYITICGSPKNFEDYTPFPVQK